MKTYRFACGVEIKPTLAPCGVFYAMGETHVEECRVFVVFKDGREMGRAETWEQAKDFAFTLITQ